MTEPGVLHEVKPVTSDDVPAVLHDALGLAVAGQIRGVVVLLAFHGTTKLEHVAGGEISIAEVALLVDHWKFEHFRGGER